MLYQITKAVAAVDIGASFESACWAGVETLLIGNFRSESSDHRPKVECKLQYDDRGIYGLFQVEDRYIRCVADHFQASVCLDSCVEFFLEPPTGEGYINFEFSGNGQFLAYHVMDARRTANGFAKFEPLTAAEGELVKTFHTLPGKVEPEIVEPTTWRLGFFIPFALFAKRFAISSPIAGQSWRGNLFKCGDHTSHPHWASWQPVPELNFHEPVAFGSILFQ